MAGEQYLGAETLKSKSPTYLFNGINEYLHSGPIKFKLLAQTAGSGGITDNATIIWPEEREVVELGTMTIEKTLNGKRV